MKNRLHIASLASLVRIHLAFAVVLLFSSAGLPRTVVAGTDKAVRIEKTVEALHVDFSSKINVPAAPERFTIGFYLLPDQLFFTSLLPQHYAVIVPYLGSFAKETICPSVQINAP